MRGAHAGLFVVDARDGSVLYARASDEEFMPASTLKLVVGSAALARLGNTFRFHTEADVQDGRLVLRGGGDPFLDATDMDALAAAVVASGSSANVSAAKLLVDSSLFDDEPYPPGWVWDDFPYAYAPVVTATSFEENAVHVTAAAGAQVGAAARVAAGRWGSIPPPAPCEASDPLGIFTSAVTAPAASGSTLDATRDEAGCTEIVGAVPLGGDDTVDVAMRRPEALAATALADALRARGVTAGGWELGTAGRTAAARLIWGHDSVALPTLLAQMWLPSDNLLAELLLKTLGVARSGPPGTSDNGIAQELAYLGALGVDRETVTLRDGSGLSVYDRITPRALVAVLQADWNGPQRGVVLDALPVAGVRGTLSTLFAATPAAGRVFAKSGSMSHVRALAGYVATRGHGAVTFALLVDDYNGESAALDAFRGSVLARLVGP